MKMNYGKVLIVVLAIVVLVGYGRSEKWSDGTIPFETHSDYVQKRMGLYSDKVQEKMGKE